MENTTEHEFSQYMKKHKNVILLMLAAALLIVFAVVVMMLQRSSNVGEPTLEFDPNETPKPSPVATSALPAFSPDEINQLLTELAKEHAALIKANTEYQNLEIEKSKLLVELAAKEVDLKLKTPPVLDFKKIIGMYEGFGELVTLTYRYEVTVEAKTEGTFLGIQNKTILYAIPGTLKIGVNFDKVKNGIVADDINKTAIVKIPAAYFVSNEIDEGNVKRYDVSQIGRAHV